MGRTRRGNLALKLGPVDGRPRPRPKAIPGTRTYRLPWADLLKKVFAVDVLACPDCGGRLQIIAFIADDTVARRILLHLGLDSRGPPVARAQAPPDFSELVQIILDQRAQIP